MSADEPTSKGFSLRRWSRRKLEAAQAASAKDGSMTGTPPAASTGATVVPGPGASASAAVAPPTPATPPTAEAPAPDAEPTSGAPTLPPIESLTLDSDFAPFLQPRIDEGLKRRALKQLFRDPRFNVMDGLDVYIDDYSKPDPIAPDLVKQLVQGRYVFDPPATRVNERGEVEDLPPGEIAARDSPAQRAAAEQSALEPAVAEQGMTEQPLMEHAAAEQIPAADETPAAAVRGDVHGATSSAPDGQARRVDPADPAPKS